MVYLHNSLLATSYTLDQFSLSRHIGWRRDHTVDALGEPRVNSTIVYSTKILRHKLFVENLQRIYDY